MLKAPADAQMRNMEGTNYGGLLTRSEGRLSEDNAFIMGHVDHFGSAGYPIVKRGRGWTWEYLRVSTPTIFRTKRACIANFELHLEILRDRLAGRL